MKRLLRRTALVMAVIAVMAVVVDRVSLTLWRHQMQAFGDQLQKEAKESAVPAGPLLIVLPPRPSIGLPEKRSINLFQAGVHADFVEVDERGALQLVFLPPAVAWSTRLYPRRGVPPISHYLYMFHIWRQPQDGQLRVSMKVGAS